MRPNHMPAVFAHVMSTTGRDIPLAFVVGTCIMPSCDLLQAAVFGAP
jgi:hypothetical protein